MRVPYMKRWIKGGGTGSRSTFKFPSRVNLSGPCLYGTSLYGQDYPVQQGWRGQTLCFIYVQFTFTKGAEMRRGRPPGNI